MTKKQKKAPRPASEKVPDGDTALERTAELVRKIVSVPKSEVPTDSRKRPDSD